MLLQDETGNSSNHKMKRDLEERIGRIWLNRIGVLFVSIALLFFLRLTYDRIGDAARALLGFSLGTLLLLAGAVAARKQYRPVAVGLIAAGCIALYLSAFASYAVFHLLPQFPSLLLMALITTVTLLSAMWLNQPFIACVGLAGGFLAPAFLGSAGLDQQSLYALLGYLAVLNLCLLWLSHYRRWPMLFILGFLATQAYLIANSAPLLERVLPASLGVVGGFFLIFATLGIYQNIIRRQSSRKYETCLALLNGLALLGWVLFLFYRHQPGLIGLGVLGVAAVHLCLGLSLLLRCRKDKPLLFTYLGAAIAFATLAVPLQLRGDAVTLTWLAEAVLLVWLGRISESTAMRISGLALFILALVPTISRGWAITFHPVGAPVLFPPELWSGFGAALAAYMIALIYRGLKPIAPDHRLGEVIKLSSSLLLSLTLTCQWWVYTAASFTEAHSSSLAQLGFFLIWAIEGLYLICKSLRFRSIYSIPAVLTLAGLTIKALINAAWHYSLPDPATWLDGFLGQNLALVALTMLFGRLWTEAVPDNQRATRKFFVILAAFELWLFLTLETVAWPRYLLPDHGRAFALSAVWAFYAIALIVAGLRLRQRLPRISGLLLLGVTLIKVSFFDLYLIGLYRVFSFLVFGLVLLLVSFLYQKWGRVFFERDNETA